MFFEDEFVIRFCPTRLDLAVAIFYYYRNLKILYLDVFMHLWIRNPKDASN